MSKILSVATPQHADLAEQASEERQVSPRYFLTGLLMAGAGLVYLWQQIDSAHAFNFLAPMATEIRSGRWDALWGSVLLHADPLHLLFNLYWVWIFGKLLETHLNRGFWLLLFLACTAFGSAFQFALTDQLGIGLSGAVYGWFGFIWFARPKFPAFASVATKTVATWLFGWLILCFVLTHFKLMHIANGAHLGGLLAGTVIGVATLHTKRLASAVCAVLLVLAGLSLYYSPWAPSYLASRAMAAADDGDTATALKFLNRLADRQGGWSSWALAAAADLHGKAGDFRVAAEEYRKAAPDFQGDSDFLNRYAWLLATAPDETARDGRRAVEVASRAASLTQWQDPAVLDTFAAAAAEAGDFSAAVKWQGKALELASADKDMSARLALYQAGQPYREYRPTPRLETAP